MPVEPFFPSMATNGQNGWGLTGDGGLIEGEKGGTEEGNGLLVGIGLEVRMDID